jgi:hypothetical protein
MQRSDAVPTHREFALEDSPHGGLLQLSPLLANPQRRLRATVGFRISTITPAIITSIGSIIWIGPFMPDEALPWTGMAAAPGCDWCAKGQPGRSTALTSRPFQVPWPD